MSEANNNPPGLALGQTADGRKRWAVRVQNQLPDAAIRAPLILATLLCCALPLVLHAAEPTNALAKLQNVHRIVFLGDSITYSGQYVESIEAYFATRPPPFGASNF